MLITTLRVDRSADVEELIERIMESDKFDLLANRIADRAVEMLRNIHNVTISRMGVADYSHHDTNGRENQSKPDRTYRPTIREHSPFSDIGLKYKKFLKNKVTTDKKYVRNANNISGETKATKKRKRKYQKGSNKTEIVKKYKSKFKQSNTTNSSGATKGGGGVKYKRDEKKFTTKGNGEGYGGGDSDDNHSLLTSSKNTDEVRFKSSNRESSRPSEFESGKSKRKRVLRKENGRLYYLDSSSDYGPYKDKIYDTADLM